MHTGHVLANDYCRVAGGRARSLDYSATSDLGRNTDHQACGAKPIQQDWSIQRHNHQTERRCSQVYSTNTWFAAKNVTTFMDK